MPQMFSVLTLQAVMAFLSLAQALPTVPSPAETITGDNTTGARSLGLFSDSRAFTFCEGSSAVTGRKSLSSGYYSKCARPTTEAPPLMAPLTPPPPLSAPQGVALREERRLPIRH